MAGIESWKHILFAPVIQSFLTIRIPRDRSDSFVVCYPMGETCSHLSMPRTHGLDPGVFPGADLGFTTV